jgi:hypothetical protein
MVNILFTATRAASDQDDLCSVVAVGNEEQYLELQRSQEGLYMEVGGDERQVGFHAGVERIRLDQKRLELRLTPEASTQLGTEGRLHIPLRLSAEEARLLRENLREITADLICFEEALQAAA